LINSNNLLDESQRIAKTGSWKYNIKQIWSGQKDIIVFLNYEELKWT
jgi:hypothetical protein